MECAATNHKHGYGRLSAMWIGAGASSTTNATASVRLTRMQPWKRWIRGTSLCLAIDGLHDASDVTEFEGEGLGLTCRHSQEWYVVGHDHGVIA
jgi:hypothetical protein